MLSSHTVEKRSNNNVIINALKLAYTQNDSNVFAYMLQLIYNIYIYITKARFSFCAHINRRDTVNRSIFRIFRLIYMQHNHIQSSDSALFTRWTYIWHTHIYCKDMIQLLYIYTFAWCSKSIDFLLYQIDLHASQSHTLRKHNTVFAHIYRMTATFLRTCCNSYTSHIHTLWRHDSAFAHLQTCVMQQIDRFFSFSDRFTHIAITHRAMIVLDSALSLYMTFTYILQRHDSTFAHLHICIMQ